MLNGKPGVSPATRQAVLTALDLLGYERPVRLRQRSTGLVGLVTPELDNPIFPAFAQVIEQALTRHGYTPVLGTQMPGGATEDELIELLVERGVGGIVFVSGLHADTTADLGPLHPARGPGRAVRPASTASTRGSPPRSSPRTTGPRRGWPCSIWWTSGTERIGLAVGPQPVRAGAAQDRGLPAAMAQLLGATEVGRADLALAVLRGGRPGGGGALLERGLHGRSCARRDLMALGAIRAARHAGLSVPGEVSVVGFDDSPLIAFTDPPLTTVRQPVRAMAKAAVDALLEEIAGSPCRTPSSSSPRNWWCAGRPHR